VKKWTLVGIAISAFGLLAGTVQSGGPSQHETLDLKSDAPAPHYRAPTPNLAGCYP